jgi:hypothetical protein
MPPEPSMIGAIALPPDPQYPKARRPRRRLPPGLIRAAQAAVWCSVGLRTWRTWDASGRVPRAVRIGAIVLWSLAELRSWRDAGCPTAEHGRRCAPLSAMASMQRDMLADMPARGFAETPGIVTVRTGL